MLQKINANKSKKKIEIAEMEDSDIEASRAEADELLMKYTNDPEIEEVFERIRGWDY